MSGVRLPLCNRVADVDRLRAALDRPTDGFLLVGRRHLRSNNSWMHNLPALSGGTNRCTLQMALSR